MVAKQSVDVHVVVARLEPVLVVLVGNAQEHRTSWIHLDVQFLLTADNLVAV